MTGVTICPECQKQVIVPEGTFASAQVECPLCNQQFALSEAIPDDAPVLQVIDPGPEAESSDIRFEDLSDESMASEPVFEASGEDDVSGEAPSADGAFSFALDADDAIDSGDGIDATAADTASADMPPDADTGFPGSGESSEAVATESARASRSTARKKTKKLGMKAQVFGIVGFGVLGLALGYGILHFFFPENAKRIRDGFGSRLGPVGALWSSEGDDDGAGNDDFVPGGALPEDQRPTKEEVTDVKGLEESATDDSTSDNSNTDDGQKKSPATDDGQDAIDATQRRFAQLLNGQPDVASVITTIDAALVTEAVTATRELAAKDGGKVKGKLYLGLCELGHKLAFVEKYTDGAAELSRTEAAELIRQVGQRKSQVRLSNYCVDMLYSDKRPKDKNGIFLVGVTQIIKPYGELFATEVELTKRVKDKQNIVKRVIVLSEERPDMTLHEPVGVLGTVVRDPVAKLPGYDPHGRDFDRFKSDDTLVVLAGVVTLLPEKKE